MPKQLRYTQHLPSSTNRWMKPQDGKGQELWCVGSRPFFHHTFDTGGLTQKVKES